MRRADDRYSAHIAWRHEPARDEILLTTPLGQGIAEAIRDGQGARLTLADRRQYSAADWDALSEQAFGVRLPLTNLPRWLLGAPADPAAGWQVEILEREDSPANPLPTLIELRGQDTEVRLKIDEWREVQ